MSLRRYVEVAFSSLMRCFTLFAHVTRLPRVDGAA